MTGRVRVPPFTTTSDCHDLRPITQLSQQGPLAQWPELLPRLSAMLDAQRSAPTAQEGLAALRAQTFDVVLTDIEMPDMNGFEFAETIRSDSNLGAMPIIGLSALVSPAWRPCAAP